LRCKTCNVAVAMIIHQLIIHIMKKILSFMSALLLASSMWAAQTAVAPGDGTLSTAISAAASGDVLLLSDGNYSETSAITLDKALTIRADGASQPVVQLSAAIAVSAEITVDGIAFAGTAGNDIIDIVSGTGYDVNISGCSFKDFAYGIYVNNANVQLDNLIVDNCTFNNYTGCAIADIKGNAAPGVIKNVEITNCTMTNGGSSEPAVYIHDHDGNASTEGPKVLIDHCTLYNAASVNYTLYLYKIGPEATISNCIVSNPADLAASAAKPYYGYDNFNVTNCLWYNCKGGNRTPANATKVLNADPQFVDIAAGNYALAEGSAAIGAATDGGNLGDPRWDPSKIQVAPGTGTLSAAVAAAPAGATLILKTGEYTETTAISIDRMVTIQAAKGAEPVVKMGSHFTLNDGGLVLQDMKLDGNNTGDYLVSVAGNKAMNITLQGLEICNFKKYMVNIDAKYHVDSVFIDDCYIHDMTRSVIYGYANTSENNLPGCSYFKFTNSTAINMGAYSGVAEVFIRNNSNDTQLEHEPTVVIDHVTMYNILASYGAVKTEGGSVTISNCIFDLTASGKAALSLKSGTVNNCLFYETTPGADFTATDTLLRDPQFVNPSVKDLKFKKTSPAIGAGTDGTNIGDPRWGVQGDEYSFAIGDPAEAAIVYEPSYEITWTSNDPEGTATVTLEYATAATGPWTMIVDSTAAATSSYVWDMTTAGFGTYYIKGTFHCPFPIEDVADGTVQYAELLPVCYYVATTGDDANDGLSWATAKATITAAKDAAQLGDTVKVAEGTYNEYFSIKDGVHVFGSYNISTGLQSFEATPSILDGTDLGHFLIVKYDNGCTVPTTINGFIIQNAEHAADGGGAFIRQNCILENCIVRNCTTSGAGAGVYNNGGIVRNCTIELNYTEGAAGAVRNREGGILENCIIRGNQGKYAAVRNEENAITRNCVFYNNEPSVEEWPASGGVYNPSGYVYNCTFANNYGQLYAGTHSDNVMFNCIFWNNPPEDGSSAEHSVYISGSSTASGSGDNAADDAWEAKNFTIELNADNMNAAGPNFVSPTNFVGAPKNDGQIAAMRAADYSLLATSPLIDAGRSKGAPETDINGVTRPKGTGVDMGAYEYDPDAPVIAVEGVALNVDTLFVQAESTNALAAIFTPRNATNRNVTWWIEDETIATIDQYGVVSGLKVGQTRAAVKTEDGNFTDTAIVVVTEKPIIIIHPEVLLYDSLYPMVNYTVPSFVPFWIAKEAARKDSSEANLQAMRDMVPTLVSKEFPYCLIANINGDPKTRMAFNWFTNEGITGGKVQIVAKANATAADFAGTGVIEINATTATTKALRYAVSASGIIKATGMDSKTAYKYICHKAIAEGLTAGTTYSYRVGYDTYWSEIAAFETAKADQGEYSFLLMSDSHILNKEYVDNARACAEAAVKNVPEAKFVLFPGDAEETGTVANSEWEWEQWFETSMRPALYKMPFVPTDGNHEDTPNGNWDMHYNTDTLFNVSSVIKPQFKGITYSFVYGDVLFLVFSMQDYWRGDYSETDATSIYLTRDVGNWMKAEVAKHPECKYRVTVCHKNVFSGSGHQEDDETPIFRNTMMPIFKECEIDLALQGHDHCYEVMGPVVADSIRPITSAISGVKKVAGGSETNMTGLEGGTFTVDDGTLYFIGATCGRKRYYPYTRAEMDANIAKHRVTNYYDLFTSKFGQPGSPMYTKVSVKSDGLYLDSYNVNISTGAVALYNSIKVVRNRPHTTPLGFEEVQTLQVPQSGKFIHNGQLYILRDGKLFNAMGQRM